MRIAGELDLLSAGRARYAITDLEASAKRIIVDLSQVTFCDIEAARVLVSVRERVIAGGTDFLLQQPSRAVRRVLALTGAVPAIRPGAGASQPPLDSDTAAICQILVGKAVLDSGADMGNVQVLDASSRSLKIVAQQGFGHPFLDFFESVRSDESACGAALATGRAAWVPDVAHSPIFAGTPALAVMLEAGAQAVASVPVTGSDGRVVAMISAHRRVPTRWSDWQKERLESLATAAGRLLALS